MNPGDDKPFSLIGKDKKPTLLSNYSTLLIRCVGALTLCEVSHAADNVVLTDAVSCLLTWKLPGRRA